VITLKNVSKSFDNGLTWAVRDLDLEIGSGETFVLLGSSGCGKTTTLKMINRLVPYSAGALFVQGRDVMKVDPVELRRSIGYVFQDIGLFPHMTVEENVSIVLRLKNRPATECRDRAHELLTLVGLDPSGFAARFPDELSGGQQQRVGVARALAADPEILLMDEPFGALDAITRDSLQQELLRIRREMTKTIVFVTHDIFEALLLGDRIGVMHNGTLQQVGTREDILRRPSTDFVRDLFETPRKRLRNLAARLDA